MPELASASILLALLKNRPKITHSGGFKIVVYFSSYLIPQLKANHIYHIYVYHQAPLTNKQIDFYTSCILVYDLLHVYAARG